ncbi:MAG: L-ribulose-5-phosphate 3-epimerase, partial [Anaerolineaceae bacterium]|nr:L-ribulose-5-phosphate 3-epimerase [Anaerolineaceae bacterium]
LGLYEKAMPLGLSFREMLLMTSRCGFDRLEISIDESDPRLDRLEWSNSQIHKLQLMMNDTGVPIRTMCLSGHRRFPLGSHDPKIRERSLDLMNKAVNFCAQLGIVIIQLAGYDVYYETGDDFTKASFSENLAYSTEYASKYGVFLGFETMETPFMDTVTKVMKYVDKIKSPFLGVYPDIGNLKNAAVLYGSDLLSDIKRGQGHIFAAHLKETRPGVFRDMRFGTGHTEYHECIKLLWSMGVRMFTGEFWYDGKSNAEETISEAASFLRTHIEKVVETVRN